MPACVVSRYRAIFYAGGIMKRARPPVTQTMPLLTSPTALSPTALSPGA
jgi:hypothetical protein